MTTKTKPAPTKPSVVSVYEPGSLHHVPPGDLLLQRNIRDSAPTVEMIASVKDVGVLQPITAVITADGGLLVRHGHRRVLAGVEAGRESVPVYVTGSDDLADMAEIARIVGQRDENTHRTGLSAGDDIAVFEQLAAFGLSADQIAKKTRAKRDVVDTALTVSGSKVARAAATRYESLTLDQAAAVAEFDGDEETMKALVVTAVQTPDQFAHFAQQARDERDLESRRTTVLAQLAESGVTVVDEPGYSAKVKPLTQLADDSGKHLTPASHKKCPGHVAWLGVRWDWVDTDGVVVAQSGGHQAAGHRIVRREWLAEFASRKTAPKGSAAFIVQALQNDLNELLTWAPTTLAAEWLSIEARTGFAAAAEKATEGRALQIALVQVLGLYEAKTSQMDWRSSGKTSRAGRYLRFLGECGYGLSVVEKFALNTKTV